ncbi:hypothetical protein GCM10020221_34890 [Streptomyces thioluteus]|uniref:UvrD-like helicase C-terminal domain-containing protein n=1 Tax=Streptomyces thioluteus TaxID=66431 RepID=A0ABN3X5R1_STRTU
MVRLANGLLAQARGRAADHRLELVSQRESGPGAGLRGVSPTSPPRPRASHRRVRDLIASGVPAGEIAVLYRINAQSEGYEQALADVGVPYQLRGAERFFERPEVREAQVLLRGAARAADGTDPGWPPPRIWPTRSGPSFSTRAGTPEPPAGSGAVRDRWESLAALVRLAEDFARSRPGATLADLVTELQERTEAQHAPTVEGVTLASLHAAKGPGVGRRLPGRPLTEGMLPITYAKTDEQIERSAGCSTSASPGPAAT